MPWAVAGAAIAAGGAIYSSDQQSQAAKNAAATQQQGQANAMQSQLLQQQQTQQQLAPYTAIGGPALGELGYLMGLPGYANPTANPSFGPQASNPSGLPVNPKTGTPYTLNDFMAYNTAAAPGDTNNMADAQAQYSQYLAGAMNSNLVSRGAGNQAWSSIFGGAQMPGGAPMGGGQLAGAAPGGATGTAPTPGGGGLHAASAMGPATARGPGGATPQGGPASAAAAGGVRPAGAFMATPQGGMAPAAAPAAGGVAPGYMGATGAPGGLGGVGAQGGAGGAGAMPGGYGSLLQPFTGADLQNTPGYQFQMQQGLQALQNRAAAGGTLQSPNTQEALVNYAEGLAGTRFDTSFQEDMQQKQQEFNQLMGIAGLGSGATSISVGQGAQTGQSLASGQINMANAAATGQLGQGAANQNLYQNLASIPGMMSGFYNKTPAQTPTFDPSLAEG
jgi:hypothetical protein